MSKKLILMLVFILAVAMPFSGLLAQDDDSALPDLEGRTVTVAVENAYPPFNSIDEDGNAVGWDYDVINELCDRLNCVPEYIETAWDGMILAVSNGEFDMAADGITITEEREEVVDFSQGYMTLEQVLLVRTDEERFDSIEAFVENEDFTVGVQPGTTNFFTATELFGEESPRIVAYDTFPVAVQALIAGDVDAAIMDNVAGQGYVGANPDAVALVEGTLTGTEALGFIFPEGSELTDAMNAGLDSMDADGSLLEITNRWFTE